MEKLKGKNDINCCFRRDTQGAVVLRHSPQFRDCNLLIKAFVESQGFRLRHDCNIIVIPFNCSAQDLITQ